MVPMCAVLDNVRENVAHGSKTFTTRDVSKQIQGVLRESRVFFRGDKQKSAVMNLLLIQLWVFLISRNHLILST